MNDDKWIEKMAAKEDGADVSAGSLDLGQIAEDEKFIHDLERRSMSTWTDAELDKYARLTGQPFVGI